MDLSNIQVTQECLKAIRNIGSITYQNVCNGNIYTVPWGTLDWIGTILISLGLIAFIGPVFIAIRSSD